ncbi:MAG TPA: MarR family winged helix-turn-helix transcriptional regulator [Thermoanaerobaculia bacterium]|nr:MarR family winged helix-turn-helix transcriptional regulator [Thermoanaerobaculia bacterium]
MNAALELVETVITTFRTLRIAGGKLHGRSGPLTGERGVIMDLARIGPDTVPNMARVRGTSRQHIQVIVDRLIEAGQAERRENPSTRRSPLIALTRRGQAEARRMAAREAEFFAERVRLKPEELRRATATLRALAAAIAEEE